MHPVILERLEDYLSGTLLPADSHRMEAHLAACAACREELRGMQELSSLFAVLKPVGAIEPPLGFATRVTAQAVQARPGSFWDFLSLDPAFGRRVVFASLLTLALLGSYLVSQEARYTPGPMTPEAAMANEQIAPQSGDRDRMLVTLASYEP